MVTEFQGAVSQICVCVCVRAHMCSFNIYIKLVLHFEIVTLVEGKKSDTRGRIVYLYVDELAQSDDRSCYWCVCCNVCMLQNSAYKQLCCC